MSIPKRRKEIGTTFGVLFDWIAARIPAVIASAYLRIEKYPTCCPPANSTT